jgi:hypothetical protein
MAVRSFHGIGGWLIVGILSIPIIRKPVARLREADDFWKLRIARSAFQTAWSAKRRRCHKEGRYLIALAHEETMESATPSLIGFSWTSADGFRRSLTRSHSFFASSCLRLNSWPCILTQPHDHTTPCRKYRLTRNLEGFHCAMNALETSVFRHDSARPKPSRLRCCAAAATQLD